MISETFPEDRRLTVRSGDKARDPREPDAWVINGPHGVGKTLADLRRYGQWLCEMADKIERDSR